MSETTLSSRDKLVYMANQIAKNFAAEGEAAAVAATADHIAKFWDPRMRAQIRAIAAEGGALDAVAQRAVALLGK